MTDELVQRTDVVEWRASGVYLVSRDYPEVSVWSDGSRDIESRVCTYDPPMLLYKVPLRDGDSWDAEGVCRYEDGTSPQTYSFEWEVQGRDRVEVGSRSYRCPLVVERTRGSIERTVTRCFSPALGLAIRTVEVREDFRNTTRLVRLP